MTGEPKQAPPLLSVGDLASIYTRAIALGSRPEDDTMTDHQHFARHMLQSGDHAITKFECRAAETADCRTVCQTCINDEGQEQCVCEYREREPNLVTGQQCNYLLWMEHAPEESYDGDEIPVRGPGWQPVVFSWEGDYFVWEYAATEEKDIDVDVVARAICGTTSAGKLFPWPTLNEKERQAWRAMATAAIDALRPTGNKRNQ